MADKDELKIDSSEEVNKEETVKETPKSGNSKTEKKEENKSSKKVDAKETVAQKLMDEHKVSKIYRSSDGTWFTLKNNADNHARSLGTKTEEFEKTIKTNE